MNDLPATEKWTEIEHLPEWDEEFYDVYTAKKHGKWVMLKTLKPEHRDDPAKRDMISREFDVRYNLAHPNIVMINDFEEVPGLGMCIITDDVYGDSLRKLIDTGKVTRAHLDKVTHELVDALGYIHANHLVHQPIRPERILFTENVGNLKLIDVGFDQKSELRPDDVEEDMRQYGEVLRETLDALHDTTPALRGVCRRCVNPGQKPLRSADALHMAISGDRHTRTLIWFIAFLVVIIVVLAWLTSPWAPAPPHLEP